METFARRRLDRKHLRDGLLCLLVCCLILVGLSQLASQATPALRWPLVFLTALAGVTAVLGLVQVILAATAVLADPDDIRGRSTPLS